MTIEIYNTLTRRKEPLRPIEPGKLRMYVCGVTTYDLTHIGHGRTFVAFDVMQRWLRARGFDLTYVRNITDIEDKIIRRAAENGETPSQLTARYIAAMHEDFAALGMQQPDHEPRATDYVPQMLDIIGLLQDTRSCLPGRRWRRELRGPQLSALRQAVRTLARRTARRRAGCGRREQARPARLRALEEGQARRAAVAVALGRGPPGMAHRVLGDGERTAGADLRHPWRRTRPDLPAPRERDRAERRGIRAAVREPVDPHRRAAHGRRQDVEVARQRRHDPRRRARGTIARSSASSCCARIIAASSSSPRTSWSRRARR